MRADSSKLGVEGVAVKPCLTRVVATRMDVRGVSNLPVDPRVPKLIVDIRRYRRCAGLRCSTLQEHGG